MKFNIVMAIISFFCMIGFCTGQLDWLIIYYGCAPENIKSNIDGAKVLLIATVSNAIIFGINMISILIKILGYELLIWKKDIVLTIIVLVIMFISTYIICNAKLYNKVSAFLIKLKNPVKSIDNQIKYNEMKENREEKKKLKEQKRAEYIKSEQIKNKMKKM